MSIDIIEIALDYLTDASDFEKLASEIMYLEGYHDIKPLGGVKDRGQDAIEDKFHYREGKTKIIFQYTLQDYIWGKLRKTIKKLEENKIDFTELIIVTPVSLSNEREFELEKKARKEFDVTLKIYSRKTIVNRLSDLTNGIFYRHFPSIDKQITTIKSSIPAFEESHRELETEMLRISLTFVFGKGATTARKSVFDNLILASLVKTSGSGDTLADISNKISKSLGCGPFPESQIDAALLRLKTQGLVDPTDGRFTLSESSIKEIGSANIEAKNLAFSLVSDIVERVCNVWPLDISREERRKLERNTKDVFAELFRIMGTELINQFQEDIIRTPLYFDSSQKMLDLAKSKVNKRLGELLVAAIADTIQSPSSDQAKVLANWARAYVGAAVMNLNPVLQEFQAVKLKNKIFILDTDFVLRLIIQEHPKSEAYLAIIKGLDELGCKLVIPEAVVEECVNHISLAPKTYRFFGHGLLSMTPEFVERKVYNALVSGYYYGKKEGLLSDKISFKDYRHNYYEHTNPSDFVQEIINARFPSKLKIINLSNLIQGELPEDVVNKLSKELCNLLRQSPKSEYRTPEEEEKLANTDARLFLTALELNEEKKNQKNRNIVGGTCYIITNQSRYLRSAKKLNIRDVISTRPQQLLTLVELVKGPKVDDIAFVRLFENPLLKYAVDQSWDDVNMLISSGISLRGKSLVRLRWDLDEVLHKRISTLELADKKAETSDREEVIGEEDLEYIELFHEATSLGYLPQPILNSLHEKYMQAKNESEAKTVAFEQLKKQFDQLASEIERFGKKKQRYLRRIARQKKKN